MVVCSTNSNVPCEWLSRWRPSDRPSMPGFVLKPCGNVPMRVHGCLDGNCLFDRLSMPGFVLNPQWDVPLWVAVWTCRDCLIDTPVPVVAWVQPTWWCSHMGGCLDRNWQIDRLSMPDFGLNPHGNIHLCGRRLSD